ncbi:MAG TPA: alkaline phosphatase family protein, partial [Opitutales bacterium]|nr:alkaline phosphatase family protein [Opitutales bacterium]
DRKLIPSPKEVATYDQKPEMSAYGVRDAAVAAILSGKYGLIVVNFANSDMVGHTGKLDAAVAAVQAVDSCVAELLQAIDEVNGAAVITADHGNSDQMWVPETNAPHTSHTMNPVEVVVYGKGLQGMKMKDGGRLADLAPTVLKLMGLPKPEEMTGDCLLVG